MDMLISFGGLAAILCTGFIAGICTSLAIGALHAFGMDAAVAMVYLALVAGYIIAEIRFGPGIRGEDPYEEEG